MLEVQQLRRSYGGKPVVDDVSFGVAPGRITGFVGANGAGKTTTMRMILGILSPDAGAVLFDGDPITTATRRRFGYMPEERGLYPKMKVLDQVRYFGELHGMSRDEAHASATEVTAAVGVAERHNDTLKDLSLGNQQRVQVAAALVHNPIALVLDEPFSGLDPFAVDALISVLRKRARSGVPVLFSSHQLDLVERLCDDIVILSSGRKVASGTVDELRDATGVRRYRLVVSGDAGWVRQVPGVTAIDVDGGTALCEFAIADEHRLRADLLTRAMSSGDEVVEFARVLTPLSEIFREAVEK